MSNERNGRRVEVYPGKEAVVRFDPDRTFTCVDECTWCCHHGVLLYDADLHQLAEHVSLADSTEEVKARRVIPTEQKGRTEHVGPDGHACRFLADDGRCGLQAAHDWKPTRCAVFPLDISLENGEIIVDVRDDAELHCEGLDVSDRRLLDHLDAFLPPLLWDLSDPSTSVDW